MRNDAHDKVKSEGEDRAFEAFRYITHKGNDASMAHILIVQNRAMNPERAKRLKEIENKCSQKEFMTAKLNRLIPGFNKKIQKRAVKAF